MGGINDQILFRGLIRMYGGIIVFDTLVTGGLLGCLGRQGCFGGAGVGWGMGREGQGQLAGREGLASGVGSGAGWELDDTGALNLLASLLFEILRSSFLLRPP